MRHGSWVGGRKLRHGSLGGLVRDLRVHWMGFPIQGHGVFGARDQLQIGGLSHLAHTFPLTTEECRRIHPTFHVSLLKPKLGTHTVASSTLSPIYSDGSFMWFPK